MKTMNELMEQVHKCVKCGACMGQCPVYVETLEEPLVARGKISLIENIGDGEGDYNKRFSKILSQCLLCGTCSENCPNGVPADEIIRDVRSLLVKEKGLSLPKRAIFQHLLDSTYLMPMLLKGGAALQNIFLKKIPEESGLLLRFPLPYLDERRFIPPLAKDFLLEIQSGWVRAEKEIMRVGFFVGCVTNYLFPNIGKAILDIFPRRGISVFVPKNQYCCGLPAFGSGDEDSPQSLARKNIEAFKEEGLEKIVAPCASCAAMLKLDYPALYEESDPFRKDAMAFAAKIADASQILDRIPDPAAPKSAKSEKKLKVTYHDPCHLRRKLGIYEEPRRVLKSLPGLEYVEMSEANRCCGQGGSFNVSNYDLSLKILDKKIQAIQETGADVVTTACSGCLLQLLDGIHQSGLKIEAKHLVEMVSQGMLL
jgi:glycolate oxidase iron-sulfur subunit